MILCIQEIVAALWRAIEKKMTEIERHTERMKGNFMDMPLTTLMKVMAWLFSSDEILSMAD